MIPKEIPAEQDIRDAVNILSAACHGNAWNAGWWHDKETGEKLNFDPSTPEGFRAIAWPLLLIISEVIEAAEGVRKNLMDDKLPHRPMIEVELADVALRLFDTAEGLGLDLPGAIVEKLAYNQNREDHKPENRAMAGGKKV